MHFILDGIMFYKIPNDWAFRGKSDGRSDKREKKDGEKRRGERKKENFISIYLLLQPSLMENRESRT